MSLNEIYCFKCGTNNLKLKHLILNSTKTDNKRRLDKSFTPIKIGVDYTSFTKPSSMSTNNYNKIKGYIEDTIKEFQKFLKVQHEDYDISNQLSELKEYCELSKVGSNYKNFLIDNDVIIFPSFDSTLGDYVLAAAAFCLLANDLRPIAGVVYINPSKALDQKNADTYMKHLLLHEMTHILVFHPTLLKYLKMIKTSNSVSYVNSPNVVLKARQHYNCPSLTGVPLENQGGEGSVGSHWEARYMLGDYMISTDYMENVISDITIAMFEDSGFYQVEYYSGGLFKFGKNKGCDFLNKKCIEKNELLFEDEFCISPRKPMCYSSRTVKGSCVIYEYRSSLPSAYRYFSNPTYGGFQPADYCPVAYADEDDNDYYPASCRIGNSTLSNYGEYIGDNSFCFVSSLLPSSSSYQSTYQSICYKVECDSNNKKIIVIYGSSSITCPTNGGNITNPSGFKGTITCPKYTEICDFEGNIMCNSLFDCLSKKVKTDSDSLMYNEDDENFIYFNDRRSYNEIIKLNYFILSFIIYFLY